MRRLARSFRHAFAGLGHMVRTQPNFRIELAVGLAAAGFGAWLGISPTEWAILATVAGLVLVLEGVNTALELAVDLASPAFHPKAKAAKDIAAATVLMAAVVSVTCGLLIFGPRIAALLD